MTDTPTRRDTRRSARRPLIKSDTSSSNSTDEGTLSDAITEANPGSTDRGAHSSPAQTQTSSFRDDLSRLSEGLEPMNIDHSTGQPSPDAAAHEEVDLLGRGVKEAAAALSQLEGLGLQKFDISLPRCIVLGQQSTGKSSVIEAISGIKTPRDTDTCTCCPLYINMKPSNNLNDKWTARVSLQRDYALAAPLRDSTEELFPGWTPTESTQIFFAETQSRIDLEHIIRSAQSANLNPHVDPQSFLAISGPPVSIHQNKFSPNTVCIDITEPGLPCLSFFDLPGLISQAETDDEAYTVPLVHNLVAQYVKEEGSLILVTCDLGTDIANSTAAGLAHRYKATDRCIGVLTKPDLLAPGTTDESLINILDGKRFKLGHGYFVVKNLNKQEIQMGLGHREARTKEVEFFAKGRWANSLGRFQPRFGTKNLQLYLSKQLARRTFIRLPEIYDQILTQLDGVEKELEKIPVTPAHSAVRAIIDHILDFSLDVRYEMEGEHEYTGWWNCWRAIQDAFNDALLSMKPTMTTSGGLDEGIYASTLPGTSAENAFLIDLDDDDNVPMRDVTESPTKKRKKDESSPQPKATAKGTKKQPTGSPSKKSGTTNVPGGFGGLRERFVLDDVVREISQTSKSRIPNQIHPKVREALMIKPLRSWQRPMDVFFSTLEKEIVARMQYLFNKHFAKRQGTELFHNAWKIVHELLRNNIHQQRTIMAQEALVDELEGPHIFFQEVFNQEKATVAKIYSQKRLRVRFDIFVDEAKTYLKRDMTPNEQEKVRKDSAKMALIAKEPESYEGVIDLVADVKAYYNLAARRFHDSLCMRIESKFFKQLRTQLREELETGLGIRDDENGPSIAQRLLAESPEHERRRHQLLIRKEALTKGLQCLKELNDKFQGAPVDSADAATSAFGHGGLDSSMPVRPAGEA
ncbi:hypothetical protein J1614_003633 [Plenodomus biglobosus]|nr:hypothetical protein J1614_003633 [Plenodomus biglobosus]